MFFWAAKKFNLLAQAECEWASTARAAPNRPNGFQTALRSLAGFMLNVFYKKPRNIYLYDSVDVNN